MARSLAASGFVLHVLLACGPALADACTAAQICTTDTDYTASATAGGTCCNDAQCSTWNFAELDTSCTGCTGTQYTTQAACNSAGNGIFWYVSNCGTSAPSYSGYCNLLQTNAVRIGNDCCSGSAGSAAPSPPPNACTAAQICTTAVDYTTSATAGGTCCNDAQCSTYNYDQLDTSCTGCTGTQYTTQAACTSAGKLWVVSNCGQAAGFYAGNCNLLQTNAVRIGNDCCSGGLSDVGSGDAGSGWGAFTPPPPPSPPSPPWPSTFADLSAELAQAPTYNDNSVSCSLEPTGLDTASLAYTVLKGGQIVAEKTYYESDGSDWNTQYFCWSVTKTVTSILIGVLIDRGNLTTAMTLEQIFAGQVTWSSVVDGQRKKLITLEQLLTMTSGLSDPANLMTPQETLVEVLNHGVLGSNHDFEYLSTTHILAYIVRAASGETPAAFATGNSGVFAALGINQFTWTADLAHTTTNADGVHGSAYGLQMRVRDLAKVGQLYLQGGMAAPATRVLSANYVAASTSMKVGPWPDYVAAEGFCSGSDDVLMQGYGYQWWKFKTSDDTPYSCAVGHGGQYVCVFPTLDVTFAAVAYSDPGPPGDRASCTLLNMIPQLFPGGETAGCSAAVSPASGGNDAGGILLIIIGVLFVPVLMILLWLCGALSSCGCPAPGPKPPRGTQTVAALPVAGTEMTSNAVAPEV